MNTGYPPGYPLSLSGLRHRQVKSSTLIAEAANDPTLIQLGHVLPGAARVIGQGVNETYRGPVETGGPTLNCYIKFLEIREL